MTIRQRSTTIRQRSTRNFAGSRQQFEKQITEILEQHTSTLEAQDRILVKLDERLQAPVLNGGFETLLTKVQNIEHIQEQLNKDQQSQCKKIDDIHVAIYDPDKGLYSKVKDAIKWINRANWLAKGVAALLGTGVLTGLGKILYDIMTGHIHYTP